MKVAAYLNGVVLQDRYRVNCRGLIRWVYQWGEELGDYYLACVVEKVRFGAWDMTKKAERGVRQWTVTVCPMTYWPSSRSRIAKRTSAGNR